MECFWCGAKLVFYACNATSIRLPRTCRTAVWVSRPVAIVHAAMPPSTGRISTSTSCIKDTRMKTTLPIAFAILACSLLAQDNPAPLAWGGFENTGSATLGYRFTDISGYQPKFQELFNLREGPRLLDFNLFGKAKDNDNRFADDYSLTASGFGGEPFTSAQLTVRKSRLYDLRVNFRQSYYYWDRNDAAALPTGLSGLTSNHNWATVRKLGSVNLLIHATNNLKFSFEYYRNSRDGATFTTRTMDYF